MHNEVWQDAVEEAAAVAVALFAVAEQPEVLSCLWRHIRPQLNHDAAWAVKSCSIGDYGRGSQPHCSLPSDPERLIGSFRVSRAATSQERLRGWPGE